MEAATALSPVPSPTPSPPVSPAPSKTIIMKLLRVLSVLENAKKDGFNDHSRYRYISIDSLAAIARKALAKEGLVLLADVLERETTAVHTAAGKEAWCETVLMKYTLSDGESAFEFRMPGIGVDSSDKGLPKAISNSRKYAILSLLNLGGEDPESETLEVSRAASALHHTQKATPPPFAPPSPILVRPPSPQPALVGVQPKPMEPAVPSPTTNMVTQPQLKAILAVGRTINLDEGTLNQLVIENFGHPLSDLTRREASQVIEMLKGEQNNTRP